MTKAESSLWILCELKREAPRHNVKFDTAIFYIYDVGLMLWLMLLAASIATLPPGPRHPAIGVFIDFDAVPSQGSIDEMKKEAAKILNTAGYELDWRNLKYNRGNEGFNQVVVVKFHGKCRLEFPAVVNPDYDTSSALASTLVQDGRVLPFSDVQCDQVRRLLAYAPPKDRQKALGLALGRVVAHELYHFLLNTTRHAASGLTAATHDWLDLTSGSASFK